MPSTPKQTTDLWAILAACLATTLGGTMVVGTRLVVSQTDPFTMAIFRLGIATLCLLPGAYLTPSPPMSKRDLAGIAALGIMFFAFFSAGLGFALQSTTAARGGLIMAVIPILTIFVAHLLDYEHLSKEKILGALLSFAGVGAVVTTDVLGNKSDILKGDAIMLVMIVLAAFFNVLSRPYLQRYAQIRVIALLMGSGWLALTVCSYAAGWTDLSPTLDRAGWIGLLYIGTIAGAVPMFLYHWALGRIEAGQVAVCNAISPLSAALFGVLILSEPLSWHLAVGLVLVIGGVYLVSWRGLRQIAKLPQERTSP